MNPSINRIIPMAWFFRSLLPDLKIKTASPIRNTPVMAPMKATAWLSAKTPATENSKLPKTRA